MGVAPGPSGQPWPPVQDPRTRLLLQSSQSPAHARLPQLLQVTMAIRPKLLPPALRSLQEKQP